MTSPDGRALIAAAKRRAVPVASCVAARLRPDHLLSGCSRADLEALIVVLAEAHDPVKLRAVCEAPGDEGLTAGAVRELTLQVAHREFNRQREAGFTRPEMPEHLSRLETEYKRDFKRRKKRERGGVAA